MIMKTLFTRGAMIRTLPLRYFPTANSETAAEKIYLGASFDLLIQMSLVPMAQMFANT